MALMRILVLLLACLATTAFAADSPLMPKLDIGKGGKCVDDPKVMLINHVVFLKHQRDRTVRQGIRGEKHSLAGCVECHASLKNNSVLGSNANFCQGCHVYAAVKIDCFECHSNKRKVIAEASK